MSIPMQVTDEQFNRLLAAIERQDRARAEHMPDEAAALKVMFQAWRRLKDLGWREVMYCPKDGTVFDCIEAGSTGIHDCSYLGAWPNGHWIVHEGGDLWPSSPILFRLKAPVSAAPDGGGEG
ncbi:MAG TPA: hypothetical protein VD860_10050 [Azospirillum sp.]|nr:hypothetical protein [Azospirillum sp.]